MADEHHVDEETSNKHVGKSVLDHFSQISNDNEAKRVKNASLLLQYLYKFNNNQNNDEVQYALKRIIRGLGGSKTSTRIGFYSTFVALLHTCPYLALDEVLKCIRKQLQIEGGNSKSEIGDIYTGQVLACGALIRSKKIFDGDQEQQDNVLRLLINAGKSRSYLSMASVKFIAELLAMCDEEQLKQLWSVLNTEILKPWPEQTLDSLYLLLLVCRSFPRFLKGSTLNKILSSYEVLCNENLETICNVTLLARIFNDSKTFVDKKLLYSPDQVLQNFNQMLNTNPKPGKEEISKFVTENFGDGDELEKWRPGDYNENPNFLRMIQNDTLRDFAQKLVKLWGVLARRVKDDVSRNADRYSIIPVPNGFVIPGGRFREYYYWDSYWIIRSLLIGGMKETARGMIENFFTLVDRFGFVPNGGRKYYLNRSQPPLLTAMVLSYYKETSDLKWLSDNIVYLERELQFWLRDRTVPVQYGRHNLTLARYHAVSDGPRPESYFEDVETGTGSRDVEQLYVELKSGAESGWDFSSRWLFDDEGGTRTGLSNVKTTRVLPVDLNSILCGAFRTLSEMYLLLNNTERSDAWAKFYHDWRVAMDVVFWDEDDGVWHDFDYALKRRRKGFYPSNLAPLWMGCYAEDGDELGRRVVEYMKNQRILDYLGGVPTSLERTGEQWDFPNAWPPLQDVVVEGLRSTGNRDAVALAQTLAHRWVNANLLGFAQAGEMFEKYDAVTPGLYGGGGEYVVQSGFGWTNGVVLKFIYEYFI
ncbi:hypothetical protein RN001_010802 [Aquatica leii]|uniref:Trehalase n=1 Tax=Aquatica leii TaxID=1421715 RepID=A0AAN7S8P8_9COLE|nr:hypothetical protein RN001_010802 [Aquatica leii]